MGYIAWGCLTCLLLLGWFFYCNNKTNRQRQRLISFWRSFNGGKEFDTLHKEYDQVSYGQHMWSLIRLRNPKYLYGPLTRWVWEQEN